MPDPRSAFDALYDDHLRAVHAYLLARTRDRDVAQDLLQETFLRGWRKVRELADLERSRQRAWLVAVARNLVVDRSRRAMTERAAVERIGRLAAPTSTIDPAQQVERTRDLARVDRAIAALPEDQRVILSLQVLGGLTSPQIGELLEQSPGTVRYKLSQARQGLRRALEENGR
ncbi:MAG: RNA polymerase sigma factor [Candidatus Dormibacteraceae bacterium]